MNDSTRKGRLRLRHLFEETEAKAEDLADDRGRFQQLAREDAAPRVVSSDNLFQTPEDLAAEMVGHFEHLGRVLEPSAGLGRLYRAIRRKDAAASVVLVDISPECCRELYAAIEADEHAKLLQGDFLAMDAERLGLFDSVIMNPPFRRGSDILHVEHALELLKPGGRLVTICATGPRQMAKLYSKASACTMLQPGTFKPEGTNVNAMLLAFDK